MHAAGIAFLMHMMRLDGQIPSGFWRIHIKLLRMVHWMVMLHFGEIAIWGLFYWWQGCFANALAAFYFSGVTYTTVGYGDLVLASPWRLLAPVESLIGVLMCGLSTGFFFFLLSRIHRMQLADAMDTRRGEKS
jgi:hypothetical protein